MHTSPINHISQLFPFLSPRKGGEEEPGAGDQAPFTLDLASDDSSAELAQPMKESGEITEAEDTPLPEGVERAENDLIKIGHPLAAELHSRQEFTVDARAAAPSAFLADMTAVEGRESPAGSNDGALKADIRLPSDKQPMRVQDAGMVTAPAIGGGALAGKECNTYNADENLPETSAATREKTGLLSRPDSLPTSGPDLKAVPLDPAVRKVEVASTEPTVKRAAIAGPVDVVPETGPAKEQGGASALAASSGPLKRTAEMLPASRADTEPQQRFLATGLSEKAGPPSSFAPAPITHALSGTAAQPLAIVRAAVETEFIAPAMRSAQNAPPEFAIAAIAGTAPVAGLGLPVPYPMKLAGMAAEAFSAAADDATTGFETGGSEVISRRTGRSEPRGLPLTTADPFARTSPAMGTGYTMSFSDTGSMTAANPIDGATSPAGLVVNHAGQTERVIAPQHPLAAPRAELPPQVPAQITEAIARTTGPVTELRLSPEELGSVRIELRTDGDKISVTLTAERGDTLDLLRRHADRLAAEFRSAGFTELELGFGTQAQHHENSAQSPATDGSGTDRGHDGPAIEMDDAVAATTRQSRANGSLYLRL